MFGTNIEHDIDYKVHTASLASSQFYNTRPIDVLMPNSMGTYHLLELAERLVALYPEKNLQVVYEKRDDANYLECPVEKPIRMSTDKLEALGWKPKYNIEEGFKLTIDYFESLKLNER